MPAIQNLVLTDRASTPATHTFVPESVQGGVGAVIEAGASAVGNKRITISGRRDGTRKWKVKAAMTLPVTQTQTINGVSSEVITRMARVDVYFTFDESSLIQERKDALGLLASMCGATGAATSTKTLIEDVVVNQQNVFSS